MFIGTKGYAAAILLLVIGGLNWGMVALSKRDLFTTLFGEGSKVATIVYLGVAIAALALAFQRDSYLPFLGKTVMPCSLLKEGTPEKANASVNVQGLPPGAKIFYWAAEEETSNLAMVHTWSKAYQRYENAGVTYTDNAGNAVLNVRNPQAYSVPNKGTLRPHVHYRVCSETGMMSRVNTTYLDEAGTNANTITEGFNSVL